MRKLPSPRRLFAIVVIVGAYASFSVYFGLGPTPIGLSLFAFEGALVLFPLCVYIALGPLMETGSEGRRPSYQRGFSILLIVISLFALTAFLVVKPTMYPDAAFQDLVTRWFWNMLTK